MIEPSPTKHDIPDFLGEIPNLKVKETLPNSYFAERGNGYRVCQCQLISDGWTCKAGVIPIRYMKY